MTRTYHCDVKLYRKQFSTLYCKYWIWFIVYLLCMCFYQDTSIFISDLHFNRNGWLVHCFENKDCTLWPGYVFIFRRSSGALSSAGRASSPISSTSKEGSPDSSSNRKDAKDGGADKHDSCPSVSFSITSGDSLNDVSGSTNSPVRTVTPSRKSTDSSDSQRGYELAMEGEKSFESSLNNILNKCSEASYDVSSAVDGKDDSKKSDRKKKSTPWYTVSSMF